MKIQASTDLDGKPVIRISGEWKEFADDETYLKFLSTIELKFKQFGAMANGQGYPAIFDELLVTGGSNVSPPR